MTKSDNEFDNLSQRTTNAKEDRHFVTALARGLEVLHAFKSGEERLSNQELAQRCTLPKSTVTRLTYTLTKLEFLHHIPESRRYRLGLKTLALGGTTLSRLDVKEASNALLQQLANDTDCMVSLAIRDQLSMLYIDNCRSQSAILTLRLGIGSRLPLATTAIGRGYLAGAPAGARETLELRIQAVDPQAWPQVQQSIQQAVSDLQEHGCVRSFGDWRREVNAIAVPISLNPGLPLMVVNVAAAAQLISAETFMSEVRPRLIATVHSIETKYRADT
ncbi:IclR family transcriptional regulator [Polaromonas glacialis]|uniref:IclR family transcriptional regulator n=1 Tax=Polaromonas glacialis TaxID=866564 RepID=UPI00068CCC1E|nr:IclR family transcriptional regulator [Polaromonas glacialis]